VYVLPSFLSSRIDTGWMKHAVALFDIVTPINRCAAGGTSLVSKVPRFNQMSIKTHDAGFRRGLALLDSGEGCAVESA
jgi:hypothetical protein